MKLSKSVGTTFLQDLEFFYNLPKEEKPYMVAMFMKYFCNAKYSDIGEEQKINDMKKYLKAIGPDERNTELGITSKDVINKHTLANLKVFKKQSEFGILNTIMFDGFIIGQFGSDTRLKSNCKFLNTLNSNFENFNEEEKEKGYIGFDCTKPFLHYGHLKTLTRAIEYLKLDGKELVILLGTTTALIGDPTGQDIKRPILTSSEVEYNANKIMDQIDYFMHLYDTNRIYYFTCNNYLNIASFGDYKNFFDSFTVNKLIEANRMKKDGLTVNELIYPLLQAYDFYYLKKNFNCTLQLGGKDQEINMIYGKKMIKELLNEDVDYKVFDLV